MEGVGARLGRSSARYGPTTVFTGPVRRWKKKWTHTTPPTTHHHHHNKTNGASHLLVFKWTPILGQDNANANQDKEEDVKVDEPPLKRKFKYIPVAVLEEQKFEASEQVEDETETDTVDPNSKSDELNEKPDINDVPMEECQDAESKQEERQDLNESLDLSLGLNSNDGDINSQSKTGQSKDDQQKQ